jgi:hypothetical protein
MAWPDRVRTPAVVVLVVGLLAAAGAVARAREERYPAPAVSEDTLYLTSGETLRRLTVGYNALAADLYWIRTLQYFGGVRLRFLAGQPTAAAPSAAPSRAPSGAPSAALSAAPTDYPLLYPLLDLITTLDPRFNIAYRYGAIFLAEAFPGGAGRPDLAIALLEKGSRIQPGKWQYMQDLGFVHYWWRHDYPAAAEWFERASAVPGAPWFLKSLAATTLAEGGDRASSRTMWQAIRESAEDDWLRSDADRRLTQFRAMDDIDELQRRADRVSTVKGRPAAQWSEVIDRLPVDPTGTPYEFEAGRVKLSPSSTLFPLPIEPQRSVGAGR